MAEQTTPTTVTIKHVRALDGLRGIAILLVIAYHYFIFSLGWTGVDLFFVLSGFLITKRLIDNKNKKNRYAIFYTNRVLRIFPLYYLVLILFYAAILFFVSPANYHRFDFYLKNWPYFFLFLENWVMIGHTTAEHHLRHFWSLAVEEQFYLLWPWILYRFYASRYFKLSLWLTITIILITRLIFYLNIQPWGEVKPYYYSNTFWRADSFIIGALICFLLQNRRNNLLIKSLFFCSLLILVSGIVFTKDVYADGPLFSTIGYTALAFLFGSVIYFVVTNPGSFLCRLLNFPFLVKTGKISYGLYIFHWLVLITAGSKISILLKNIFPDNGRLISIVICLLISYILSFLSYYYYESYFLKQKK